MLFEHGPQRHRVLLQIIERTRSRALRGATGVKNGVKSGSFWQPLSQDVAFCCNVQPNKSE
jgi:hypothetical protein